MLSSPARRAVACALGLLVVSSAALAGCGDEKEEKAEKAARERLLGGGSTNGESKVGGATTICQPKPTLADPPEGSLPTGISAPPAGRVIDVQTQGTSSTVIYESTATVSDLVAAYKGQVAAAGYKLGKVDNEGVEAEVYFTVAGKEASVQMRRAVCPGGTVHLAVISER